VLPGAVDITVDDRFSGGALATAGDEEVAALREVARRLAGS
jgi:hypothetical protein